MIPPVSVSKKKQVKELVMILPKLPRTPAQKRVDLYEFSRSHAIESRLNRLRLIKKYNIRFYVERDVIHVYLGNRLVICVGRWEGYQLLLNECLYTMYKTLGVVEGGYIYVK